MNLEVHSGIHLITSHFHSLSLTSHTYQNTHPHTDTILSFNLFLSPHLHSSVRRPSSLSLHRLLYCDFGKFFFSNLASQLFFFFEFSGLSWKFTLCYTGCGFIFEFYLDNLICLRFAIDSADHLQLTIGLV